MSTVDGQSKYIVELAYVFIVFTSHFRHSRSIVDIRLKKKRQYFVRVVPTTTVTDKRSVITVEPIFTASSIHVILYTSIANI